MGAQSRHQVMHQHDVAARIQRIAFWQQAKLTQHLFRMLMALLAQADGVVFLIHPIIASPSSFSDAPSKQALGSMV